MALLELGYLRRRKAYLRKFAGALASAMNYDLLRHKMVTEQLARRGIHDPRVLAAMDRVPREAFVPLPLRAHAYEDRAIPIGFEQTISQPYTVAFMCQAARLAATDKVLEIGAAPGMARPCWPNWPGKSMPSSASRNCTRRRWQPSRKLIDRVKLHLNDGSLGLPAEARFDTILCTAGAEQLPVTFQEQLADGGRLVIPIGPPSHQQMYRFTRKGDEWYGDKLGSFGFVPLVVDEAR